MGIVIKAKGKQRAFFKAISRKINKPISFVVSDYVKHQLNSLPDPEKNKEKFDEYVETKLRTVFGVEEESSTEENS